MQKPEVDLFEGIMAALVFLARCCDGKESTSRDSSKSIFGLLFCGMVRCSAIVSMRATLARSHDCLPSTQHTASSSHNSLSATTVGQALHSRKLFILLASRIFTILISLKSIFDSHFAPRSSACRPSQSIQLSTYASRTAVFFSSCFLDFPASLKSNLPSCSRSLVANLFANTTSSSLSLSLQHYLPVRQRSELVVT